jgi:sarcosine oxidase, subunit beta
LTVGGDGPLVCVVGGGALGLSSALELARRGVRGVKVIEARHVAAGSSGLSVGLVETQYLQRLDIELRVRSMRVFTKLEQEHGLRVVRNGYLRLGHDAEAPAVFERSAEIQRELGVSDARVLDRGQMSRLVPDLRVEDVSAGLWGPNDGYLDGHLYCALLAELVVAAGVELRIGCELLGARERAGGGLCLHTTSGELECDMVIDAAGPWGQKVARLLGCELELIPQRRQACVVRLPRELSYMMPSVVDYTPGSGTQGVYFRHEGVGRLIAGLHADEPLGPSADPDRYARNADTEFLEMLAGALAYRLPGLTDSQLTGGWAGLYPMSPDGRPLVGPASEGSPVIVVGGGGAGIQISPALGELVADWVLHGEPRAIAGASGLAPR